MSHHESPGPSGPSSFESRLIEMRPRLVGFVRARAGRPLLRFESVDDLVQGVHAEAWRAAPEFEWRGEEAFVGWLFTIAERFMSGRRDHWFALRRHRRGLMRLTAGGGGGGRNASAQRGTAGAFVPAGGGAGPRTIAEHREQYQLAMRAVDLLLPRDRDFVLWAAEDVSIDDIARRLGVSYEAARKGRMRAMERLQTLMTTLRDAMPGRESDS